MQQIGTPTTFWTLSYAELHWPEFHTLFGDVNHDYNTYKKNVINNPHILDWFFSEKTESFVRHWLYDTLGAERHWYRFEYTVVRAAVHCHGLAKLKDDPGLCDLALKSVSAKQLLEKGKSSTSNLSELDLTVINDGNSAIICDYYDKLISRINPADVDSVHPCQKKIDKAITSSEDDYANLVNTVQRHSKCSSYYCLRQDQLGNQISLSI